MEYEMANLAAEKAYQAKLSADPDWPEKQAMCWFTDEANRLNSHLKMCIERSPLAGQQYREAACFASTIMDLCLWGEEAQSGRISWRDAKARYEHGQATAEAPFLPCSLVEPEPCELKPVGLVRSGQIIPLVGKLSL
jgi:hypothetical protein